MPGDGIGLQRLAADDWRVWRELRLAALAEAPAAFGSRLSEWQGAGDREERWRARLTDVPLNLAARWQGRWVGMVSGARRDAERAELVSLWVDPCARGRQVGDLLVGAVAEWARREGAHWLMLDVRADNAPAIALYRRRGFRDVGPNREQPPEEPPERRMELKI